MDADDLLEQIARIFLVFFAWWDVFDHGGEGLKAWTAEHGEISRRARRFLGLFAW